MSGPLSPEVAPWVDLIIRLGVVSAVVAVWRALQRDMKFRRNLQEDVYGRPMEQGRPGAPGILEQLAEVKGDVAEVKDAVGRVVKELAPNGGSSIRDSADRMECNQRAMAERQERMEGTLTEVREHQVQHDAEAHGRDEHLRELDRQHEYLHERLEDFERWKDDGGK